MRGPRGWKGMRRVYMRRQKQVNNSMFKGPSHFSCLHKLGEAVRAGLFAIVLVQFIREKRLVNMSPRSFPFGGGSSYL